MRRTRKILSLFLAMVMIIGLLPVSAFAEEGTIAPASEGTIAITEEGLQVTEEPEEPEKEPEPDDVQGDAQAEPEDPDKDPSPAKPAQEEEETPGAEPKTDSTLKAAKAAGYAFTIQPQCTYDEASDRYIMSWSTNFVPQLVQIGFLNDDGYFETRLEIGYGYSGMAESMSFPVRPEYMDWRMVVKASPTTSSSDLVESEQFETGVPFEFKSQPEVFWSTSDKCFGVKWETSITPRRVEIGYLNSSNQFVSIITKTESLHREMNLGVDLDEVVQHMYVRVHYGSAMNTKYSNELVFSLGGLAFTSQPSISSYERTSGTRGTFHLSWGMNFTPVKVEIGAYDSSGNWYTETQVPNGSSIDYEREINRRTSFYVRAYFVYLNTLYYKDSEEFKFAPGFVHFYIEHGDPHPLLDVGGIEVQWRTVFVPEKVEIHKLNGTEWERVALITDNLDKFMSHTMYYDDFGPKIRILAWTGSSDYAICEQTINVTPRRFETQPAGGTFDPDEDLIIRWKTNFNPTQTKIGYYSGGRWIFVKDVTNPRYNDSCQLEKEEVHTAMAVRVYYNDSSYVESNRFSVSVAQHAFITQPTGGTINIGGSLTVSWKTNFTPIRVEIGYISGRWIPTVVTSTDLGKSMSRSLSYDDAENGSMYVRAYYTDTDYVSSEAFNIEKVPRQFTTQPTGGTINPGGGLTLKWVTNFKPVSIEIGYKTGNSWTCVTRLTQNMAKSMSYLLPYDSAHDTMYVRAIYDDDDNYVESSAVSIDVVARQFTTQPTGGTIYPWKTLQLKWTTNYFPTKVQIGYKTQRTDGSWLFISKKEITTNLQKTMTYSLPYEEAYNGDMYVRVFYGSGSSDYMMSTAFTVNKREAYVCGDDLTATMDENGVLTLSGTGAMYDYIATSSLTLGPWYNDHAAIKKVIIPDGVTYIGKYAFWNCENLNTVTFTPSVTQIGNSAFNMCSSLKWVNYDGFKSQWDAISVGSQNASLLNASISWLYRYGELGSTGVYYQLYGYDGRLKLYGSDGSTVHLTPPWLAWGDYITEIEVGYSIDTIWDEAFRDCPNVKKVRLPGSLELVGTEAFRVCTQITDVYFDGPLSDWEDDVTIESGNEPLTRATLHTEPYYGMLTNDLSWTLDDEGLLRIFYDDGNMGSGDDTDIPDYYSYEDTPWHQLGYADDITAIQVEDKVTRIGKNAFYNLKYARTLEIADTVTSIGVTAFCNCTRLEDFTLPDSIKVIEGNAFTNCTYLELIHLPDSITTLGGGVFRDCSNLEKVWLPGQITAIPLNCFMNCALLDEIYIPGTVTSIGANAFSGCIDLKASYGHVYFDGTSAQWKQISVNATGNAPLLNAGNIHFNPEELRVDAVNFPDAQFRTYVSENFDDGSGWLTDAEIAAADVIDDEDNDYTSLKGIEYFTNLTGILVDNAPSLTSVDLSANTKLNAVDLSGNGNLKEIDLEGLDDLTYLYLSGNALTELDLTDLTDLQYLAVSSNPIKKLDVSDQSMKELSCSNTSLTSLDLSGQTKLYRLYCNNTGIKELDITGCPLLCENLLDGTRTLKTDGDGIPYVEYKLGNTNHVLAVGRDCIVYAETSGIRIDESNFPDPVFRLYVYQYLDTDYSGCLSEEEIEAATYISIDSSEDLASVQGIEYFAGLTNLELYSNENLTSVDLSANTKISYLDVSDNDLTELDLTGLTELEVLYCNANSISELDVSGNPNLTFVRCNNNSLTSLTLGEQTALSELYCYNTDLSVLDIRGCPYLVDAYLNGEVSHLSYCDKYEGPLGGILYVDADTTVLTSPLNVTFKHNCEFGANIALHYLVPKAAVEGYDNVTLEIEMEKYAEGVAEPAIESYTITKWTDYTLSGEEYCHFIFPGIFAAEMGNKITAKVSGAKSGETVYSQADEYSVKEYAYNRLEKTTSATYRTLLVDMLNYGSAAQTHFGKNAANLVNADLTATQASWGTQGELVTNNNESTVPLEGATAEINGKNLMFGSSVYLLYRMAFAEGQDMSNIKIVFTYTNLKGEVLQQTVKASRFGTSGNYYTADCTNIIPSAMRCVVSATIYDGNTPISDTLNYSIETYVHNRLTGSQSATYKALITEMLRYGISAENHFG